MMCIGLAPGINCVIADEAIPTMLKTLEERGPNSVCTQSLGIVLGALGK